MTEKIVSTLVMDYAENIEVNRKRFDDVVKGILMETGGAQTLSLVRSVVQFASLCGVGHLASPAIEKRLCKIADSIPSEIPEGNANGVLLVATELYKTGGHTRVLVRIAEILSAQSRTSLVLTDSKNGYVPPEITDAIEKAHGEIVKLSDVSPLSRAKELRTYAYRYEKIILMIHPEDAIAVVAFGTSKFSRPVFFYNHANHTFWLGASIADTILDVNTWGCRLCTENRGIADAPAIPVGIPIEQSSRPAVGRDAARKQLGISPDVRIIVAAGSPRKFRNFASWRFGDFIDRALSLSPQTMFILIGAETKAYPEWRNLFKRYGGRLRLLPPMSHGDLCRYFAAADVVVDSFPMSGWTSMIDAIGQNAATVFPRGVTGPMDYFADSSAYVPVDQAPRLVVELLENEELRTANVREMQKRVADSVGIEKFASGLCAALDAVSMHSIHTVPETCKDAPQELSEFIYAMTIREKVKFKIPFLFTMKSVRSGTEKHYECSVLGVKFKIGGR